MARTLLSLAVCSLCTNTQAQNTTAPPPNNNAPAAQAHESQGMPPRASPTDYPSQAHVGNLTIAAEFTGHAIPRPQGPLSTDDYVVVEVGFYGPSGSHLPLSRADFSLRINGKKKPFSTDPFEYVDRSLRDPAWSPPTPPETKSKTSFGTGGQGENGPPPPVHIPIELQRTMAQYIDKASLPEGDRPLPKAGLLFFPYHGSGKSIHSIQLIYSGSPGKVTLTLQP